MFQETHCMTHECWGLNTVSALRGFRLDLHDGICGNLFIFMCWDFSGSSHTSD